MTDEYIPIGEAADFLGISVDTMRRWEKRGKISAERLDGKNRFFAVADLEKLKLGDVVTVKEASKRLGVSRSTLRRLSDEGTISFHRAANGYRKYKTADLEDFIADEHKALHEARAVDLVHKSKLERAEDAASPSIRVRFLKVSRAFGRLESVWRVSISLGVSGLVGALLILFLMGYAFVVDAPAAADFFSFGYQTSQGTVLGEHDVAGEEEAVEEPAGVLTLGLEVGSAALSGPAETVVRVLRVVTPDSVEGVILPGEGPQVVVERVTEVPGEAVTTFVTEILPETTFQTLLADNLPDTLATQADLASQDEISELADTTIDSPAGGDLLLFDGISSWVSKALSGDATVDSDGLLAIADGVIDESDLNAVDSASDEECLTFEGESNFEWQRCGALTFLELDDTFGAFKDGSVLFTSATAVADDNGNFFWDDANNFLGIGTSSPTATLEVDSNGTNTVALMRWANTAGGIDVFRVDATPEGSVTGSIGDIAIDGTNGRIYIKISGSATNTGWSDLDSTLADLDNDTRIVVERTSDDDTIRFDLGGATAINDALTINQTNGLVWNTAGDNLDIRLAGQSEANLLYLDASADAIGLGISTPANRLHVYNADTDDLTIADGAGLILEQGSTGDAGIQFELTGGQVFSLGIDNSTLSDDFIIYDGATARLTIDGSSGDITVSTDLTVSGNDIVFGNGETISNATDGTIGFTDGTNTLFTIVDQGTTGDATTSGDLTISGGDITLGTTSIFSGGDTASLNNIDAIDSTTETTLEATVDIAGDVAGTGLTSVTIQPDAVALGTDTTGNYVATVADAGNSTVTVTGSGSETAAITLDVIDVNCTDCLNATEIADIYLLNSGDTSTGTLTFTGSLTNALDVSASAITNAINLGANTITGTTGVIDFTDFDVANTGQLTIAPDAALTTAIDLTDTDLSNALDIDANFLLFDGIRAFEGSTGTLTVEDTSGNDLITVTDAGTTGNLDVTGALTLGTALAVAEGGTGATTLNDLIVLGTHTTGNYLATLADAGSGDITVTGSGSETAAVTLDITDDALDFTELADSLTIDSATTIAAGSTGLTFTGILDLDSAVLASQNALVFEGATANDFETTFAITDPTVDRTITFPDATGTVLLDGGSSTLLTLAGDTGTNQTISSGDTITIAGGTNGIDTVGGATDTVTLNLDTTEIGTTTFGTGSGITWTFDVGATDPTLAFTSDTLAITAGTTSTTGDLTISGGDITLGTTSIFSGGDTASLNNVDAIDSTTESTLESVLDIAGDVTGTGLGSVTLASNVVDDAELVNALTYTGALTLTPSAGTDGTAITASSGGTTAIHGLDLGFTQSDDADATDTNAALDIAVTSSSGDADTLYGINIANLTGGTASETALNIGSGWDNVLVVNGTTVIDGSGNVTAAQLSGTLFTVAGDSGSGTIVQGDTLTLTGGTGTTTAHSGDTTTLSFDCSEVEGTDIDCSGESIQLETTIDSVVTINLAGTGTLNGLDVIDSTTETTLEAALDIAGDVAGTGLGSVALSSNVVDDNEIVDNLVYTSTLDLTETISGTTTDNLLSATLTNTSTSGTQNILVLDNAASTGTTESVLVIDNSDTDTAITAGIQFIDAGGGFTSLFNNAGTLISSAEFNILDANIDLTSEITGVLPIANGGTNKALTLSAGGIPYFDADSFEVLSAGTSGQLLTSGGTGVPTWTSQGSGNGLDADTLDSLEATQFLRSDTSDAFTSGTLTFNDSTILALGTSNDFTISHGGTNTVFDNTFATGATQFQLGTDTNATSFQVLNNTGTNLFEVDGAGTLTVDTDTLIVDAANDKVAIGNTATPLTDLTIFQSSTTTSKGLTLSGPGISGSQTTDGVTMFLGNNATGNMQSWLCQQSDLATSTDNCFRYTLGIDVPNIGAVNVGNSINRHLSFGNETSNSGFGFNVTSSAQADIQSKIHVKTGSDSNIGLIVQTNSGTQSADLFQIRNSSGTALSVIDDSGNWGIGTSAPSSTLDIVDTSTSTTAATTEGLEFTVTDTGIVTTGTDTLTGLDFNITRTGATGGTITTIGLDLDVTGDTGGTSTLTGLDVAVSGADTNYAALFSGGNVGIGDASPAAALTVGSGDLFQVDSSGNITTAADLAVNGGDITSTATTLNVDVGNTGTINFRDGTNTLASITDDGTTGTLSVNTLTLSGTGTLNGLDAIDSTTETTLESTLDIAGDVTGTGLTSVTLSSNVVDDNEIVDNLVYTSTLDLTETISGTTSDNLLSVTLTNTSTSGTQNILVLDNAASTGTTESFLVIDNSDTDTAVTNGIQFIDAGGGFTNLFNNAGTLISSAEFNILDANIDLTSEITGVLPIANGGTNKALTLSAGGIFYSDADSFEVLSAGTSGQILTSGGTGAPTWTTAGSGGGLDADTLDSIDSLSFLRSDTSDAYTSGTLTFNDSTILALGTSDDFTISHGGTNTVFDNTFATGATQFQLGTDTNATSFQILNNTGTNLFEVNGTGTATLTGDFLPSANDVHSLGSSSLRWSEVFVGPGTIHIGESGNFSSMGYNTTDNYHFFDPDGDLTHEIVFTDAGQIGVGTTSPNAHVDILETTEQLRLSYDLSNYMSVTTASDGGTTFDATGTSPDFTFNDNVTLIDSTMLGIGTGNDFQLTHNGTNTVLTSATGNLLIDNTNATGATQFQLGTDTNATSFQILNNTGTNLFEVDGAGNVGISDSTPDFLLDVAGTFGTDGNVTFGDASGDTVTSNADAWTFANDTAVTLSGGVDGLNFDSNTLSIDATNNRVGIGTAAPGYALEVVGNVAVGSYNNIFNTYGNVKTLNTLESLTNIGGTSPVLSTTNSKMGSASVQDTYPATTSTSRTISSSKDYGDLTDFSDDEDYFEFWLYVSDASEVGSTLVAELGNTQDSAEYQWVKTQGFPTLVDGWNKVVLRMGDASQGSVDWSTGVDHFRLIYNGTGTNLAFTIAIDDLRMTSNRKASTASDLALNGAIIVFEEVGIGEADPSSILDVVDTSTSTTAATTEGLEFTVTDTGIVTTGTDTLTGLDFNITRTGATGGTITTTGLDINATGDTGGTSTLTGLDVTVSGADTNYAAVFSGGNVGIGDTTPVATLQVGSDSGHTTINGAGNNLALYASGNAGMSLLGGTTGDLNIFFGDTANSGIGNIKYQNTGDLLSFYAGSAGQILLLDGSTGNVGIGTASPNDTLEVLSTSDAQLRLAYDTSNYQALQTASDGGLTWSALGTDADLNIDFSGATDGDFSVNTDDLFVDTSSGDVGIGTASPSAGLHVQELTGSTFSEVRNQAAIFNARVMYSYYSNGGSLMYTHGVREDTGSLIFSATNTDPTADTTPTLTLSNGEKVGIGTASVSSALDVVDTSTSTTAATTEGLEFTVTDTGIVTTGTDTLTGLDFNVTRTGATGGTITTTGLDLDVTGDTGGTSTLTGLDVNVSGADTNYAAVFSGGNVGIGDTTPAALLTVGGGDLFQVNSSGQIAAAAGITSSGTITLSGLTTDGVVTVASGVLSSVAEGSGGGLDADTLDAIDSLSFLRSDTSDAFTSGTLTFNDSTILALGTSNDLTISHGGTNTVFDNTFATGATQFQLGTDTNATAFQVLNNTGTNLFEVDGAGNVGIGDSTPDFTLDVAGTFGTDGNVTLGDATGDIVTSNADAWTFANDTAVTLSGGVDGINFDSNTLSIDATNNRVGIGTAAPTEKLTLASGNFLQTPGTPTIIGSYTNTTNINGPQNVDVVGKYAYIVASLGSEFTILDISVPTAPTLIANLADGTNLNGATGIKVVGKYAYVTNQGGRFTIIDISNVNAPTVAGSITGLSTPLGFYVSGNYAYVTSSGNDKLHVIDLSDPTSPSIVSTLTDSTNMDFPFGLYVQGAYAYVTGFNSDSLAVIDISDPTSPTLAGSLIGDITNLNAATDVYVSGQYAYVTALASDSLAVIDISDPTTPTHVSSIFGLDGADTLKVAGNYAYVASSKADSVSIIDISDPSSLSLIGAVSSSSLLDEVNGIDINGKYLYATGWGVDALVIIDIAGIHAPTASIGGLTLNFLDVSENAQIANDLWVDNGLSVGRGGILSYGEFDVRTTYTGTTAGSVEGLKFNVTDTGIVTTGTDTLTGLDFNVTRTGATGGTITTIGLDLDVTGDTGGTSTLTGLDVTVSGADTNYAALFSGGNVGIGDTTPAAALTVGSGDLFQVDSSGNVALNADSTTLTLGAGSDFSITHNGTNTVFDNTFATGATQFQLGTDTNATSFQVLNNTGTNLFEVDGAGNVGVGDSTPDFTLDVAGTFGTDGNVTLGDASADTVTSNAATWTFANDTAVTLSGGLDGLNFDSNTLSIDATNNRVGIGTASPDLALTVNGDANISNGNGLIVGHSAQVTAGSQAAEFQVLGTGGADTRITLGRWSASASFPVFQFVKSRNATIGSNTIVQDNDTVGGFFFLPDDGVDFDTVAASFVTEVDDASPAAGDIGTAFVWNQMPGGGSALTETMRIDSSGNLGIGDSTPDFTLDVAGTFGTDGNVTLGDATGDTVTSNADAWTFANDTAITLSGGVNGLNFDSNTLSIDATNNRIGLGNAAPDSVLDISGSTSAVNGSAIRIDSSFGDGVYINVGDGGRGLGIFQGGTLFMGFNVNYDATSDSYEYANTDQASLIEWTTAGDIEFLTEASGTAGTEYTPDLRMIVLNSGNVGIGDSTPDDLLNIHSASAESAIAITSLGTDTDAALKFELADGTASFTVGVDDSDSDKFKISTTALGTNDRLVIDSSGNVGIGTASPTDLVTVQGGSLLQQGGISGSTYAPTSVGTVSLGVSPESVKVMGDYAYVLNDGSSNNLQIIDISSVTSPASVSTFSLGSSPSHLDVAGNYVYVVDAGSDDLKIIDVSNRKSPLTVGTLSIGAQPTYVAVSGKYAYVTDQGANDFKIIDVSDPTTPVLVGSLSSVGFPTAVVVSGNYAYLSTNGNPDLVIVDISDPESPSQTSTFGTTGFAYQLAVSGKYVYLPDVNNLLVRVIDVDDPTTPTQTGTVSSGQSPVSVTVAGDYLYLSDETSTDLRVYDVSSPTSPVQVGSVSIQNAPKDADISGKYLYLVTGSSALLTIYDISGIEVQAALIHSLEAGNARIFEDLRVGQSLTVQTGLNVGANALIGGDLSVTGKFSIDDTSTNTTADITEGLEFTVTDTGIVTTGTDTLTGLDFNVTRTGATGGTITTVGLDLDVVGDTGGTSTLTGLDVLVSGADTNYAAVFSGGNVGIGVTDPDTTLQVQGTTGSTNVIIGDKADTNPALKLWGNHSSDYAYIQAGGTTANANLRIAKYQTTTTDLADFQIYSAQTYFSGNVGIGDTTPAAALTVGNGDDFQVSSTGNVTFAGDATVTLNGGLDGLNFDSNTLSIDATNNRVGIGTAAPIGKLDIENGTRSGTDPTTPSLYVTGSMSAGTAGPAASNVEFRHSNQTQGIGIGYATIYATGNNTNQTLNLLSRGSSHITLNAYSYSTGNVGIGDTTPDDLLNVHSASAESAIAITSLGTNTDAALKFELADGTATFTIGVDDSDSDKFKISTTALGTNDRLIIDSSGNVGIGDTTPDALLDVAGDIIIGTSSSGTLTFVDGTSTSTKISFNTTGVTAPTSENGWKLKLWDPGTLASTYGFGIDGGTLWMQTGQNRIEFWENGSETMVLDNGELGIGESTPDEELHIFAANATIRLDDDGTDWVNLVSSTIGNFRIETNSPSNPGAKTAQYDGDSNWDFPSDRRLKTDIEDAEPFLDKVMQLKVRRYRYLEDDRPFNEFGFIAQEVEQYFPEIVSTSPDERFDDGVKMLGYTSFGVIAIQAIQELDAKIEEQALTLSELGGGLGEAVTTEQGPSLEERVVSLTERVTELEQGSVTEDETNSEVSDENDLSELVEQAVLEAQEPEVMAAIEERLVSLEEAATEELNEENVVDERVVEDSNDALLAGLVTDETELSELLGESDLSGIDKANYRLWRVADEVVFTAKTRFLAVVEFMDEVRFGGRVTFADKDLAGLATIMANDASVVVKFENPYEVAPIVTATKQSAAQIGEYYVTNVTTSGFEIKMPKMHDLSVTFAWQALAVEEAQVFGSDGSVAGASSDPLFGRELVDPLGHEECSDYAFVRGFNDSDERHLGVDLSKEGGCPVQAVAPGVVTQAGWIDDEAGYAITIDHYDGVTSYSGHGQEDSIQVAVGDTVVTGEDIMRMGDTGETTGVHLHFGLIVAGEATDPAGKVLYQNSSLRQGFGRPVQIISAGSDSQADEVNSKDSGESGEQQEESSEAEVVSEEVVNQESLDVEQEKSVESEEVVDVSDEEVQPSPTVEILESELGFVRVRSEATVDSEHLADVTPGELYNYSELSETGWYKIEYAPGEFGWVSGVYLEVI